MDNNKRNELILAYTKAIKDADTDTQDSLTKAILKDYGYTNLYDIRHEAFQAIHRDTEQALQSLLKPNYSPLWYILTAMLALAFTELAIIFS